MAELKKVKASMMNAVHDLPLLVARDEGFFRDEGLDVDILVTPGSRPAQLRRPGAEGRHLQARRWRRPTTRASATSSACANGAS